MNERDTVAAGVFEGIVTAWLAGQAWQRHQATQAAIAALPPSIQQELARRRRGLLLRAVGGATIWIVGAIILAQITLVLCSIMLLAGWLIPSFWCARYSKRFARIEWPAAWDAWLRSQGTSLEEVQTYVRAEENRQRAYQDAQRATALDNMRDTIRRWGDV